MAWNDDGKYHTTTPEDIARLRDEKRAHPSQSTNWKLYGFDVGQETASGKRVDEDSAQTLTVVYACVRAISETVGTLPFHLYRKLSEDKRERATDHPLYPIINRMPNPEMTDMVFRETMLVHLNTWGNFYGNIVWNKGSKVEAIWPLRPDRMEVQEIDGKRRYIYTLESGERRGFDTTEMLHIPGLGFDGIIGYSPIRKNAEAIGLAMAAEEYGARFFQNDARPGVILKHPGELSQPAQDRLRKSWEDMHKGLSNKHRLGILEEGMDFATIGIPPNEAQWIELRKFQLPEICRIYRVPPPIIGDLERATFSNVEEMTRYFGNLCILPWLRRVEQHYNNKLLKESEQNAYYVEHNMDSMMRADQKSRYESYATGRQWGWFSANDVLKKENMDAIEDGDIYLTPMNMIPAAMAGKIEPKAGGLGGTDNDKRKLGVAFKPLFAASIQRVVNREILALSKVSGKTKDEFLSVADDLYENKMRGYILDSYGPIVRAYLQSLTEDTSIIEALDGYLEKFATEYVLLSRGALESIIRRANNGDMRDQIAKCLDEWRDGKVKSIVAAEMDKASRLAKELQ
jgi:HK97 family phage portal protein